MLRLLAILLALHFSSEINGAPSNDLVGKGRNMASHDDVNRFDLILDEEDTESKVALAFAEDSKLDTDETHLAAEPSLKPRTLNDSKPGGKRYATLGERLTKKARAVTGCIKTKTSTNRKQTSRNDNRGKGTDQDDQGHRAKRTKRANVEPTAAETTTAEEDDDEAGAWSPEFVHSEANKKDTAVGTVKAAGILLLVPGANPYKDKTLASFINTAYHLYHDAYDRPLPNLGKADSESQMSVKLTKLAEILQELGASEEGKKAFELSSLPNKLLSRTTKLDSTSGQDDQKPLDNGDAANKLVKMVRFLLEQKNADPKKDDHLAHLIDTAIDEYGRVYSRPPLTFEAQDNESMMNAKIKELHLIFDDLDAREKRKEEIESGLYQIDDQLPLSTVIHRPIPTKEGSSFAAMRVPKVDAQNAVNAVREALDDPDADPFEDEELAKRIDDATEKYSNAYGRRKLRLQGLDERTQMERKVKEINSIFEDMDKRNASFGNTLAQMQTLLHRKDIQV